MPLKKRIITIITGLAFLGFMGNQVLNMMAQGNQQTQQQQQQASNQRIETLEKQEKGYEAVLEREPNNENALEGLVQTRIDMKDYEGAIQPLEKLVELNPEREDYQRVLGQLKQQTNQEKPSSKK